MEAFGFPLPININDSNELERIQLKFDPKEQRLLLNQYLQDKPNTLEQELLFVQIQSALEEKTRFLLFIQGSAGTGKTTFAKKLTALARSMGLVALGCAATGLAAQVYGEEEEFTTAHNLLESQW